MSVFFTDQTGKQVEHRKLEKKKKSNSLIFISKKNVAYILRPIYIVILKNRTL